MWIEEDILVEKACKLGFKFEFTEFNYGNPEIRYLLLTSIQKWLRKVHKIHMVVWWYDEEDKFYFELGLKRGEMRYSQTGTTSNLFETYEEALEAGLVDGLNKIEI